MLTFPLWLVRPRTVPAPVPDTDGCATGGIPIAFSHADRMVDYLEAHGNSRWDVRCVAREAGLDAFADLHESGYASVCMDPEADGSGGQELTLAELILVLRQDAEDSA